MDLLEKIAQHLSKAGWTGNENNIDLVVLNELVEQRKEDEPSDQDIKTVIKHIQKLKAQNKE